MFCVQYHHKAAYDSSDSSSDEEGEESGGGGGGASGAGGPVGGPYRGRDRHPLYAGRLPHGHKGPPQTVPRTIFHRALDAVEMSWDNTHLKNILSSDTYCSHVTDSALSSASFNGQGQPLWQGKYAFRAWTVGKLLSDVELKYKKK